MSLLDLTGGVLFDDRSGRVEYRRALLSPDEAARAMRHLEQEVDWLEQRREMYGRTVDVPRLTQSFSLHTDALPKTIAAIAARVFRTIDAPFDSVGLNLYRDESDSVAPHNDHLYEIAPEQPIALVSLGATRTMIISTKQPPKRRIAIELEAGSLLVMDYASQRHYDHGIPKLRTPVGPRISLAFRVRHG